MHPPTHASGGTLMDRGEPAGQEVLSGSRLLMTTTTITAAVGATGMGVAAIGGGITGRGLSGGTMVHKRRPK